MNRLGQKSYQSLIQKIYLLKKREEQRMSPEQRIRASLLSSLTNLLRVTAWVQRFIKNCRLPKNDRQKGVVLNPDELNQAEIFWLRQSQREMFPDKEKDDKLRQFSASYDGNGLLRANGRLKFADELPFDSRCPILLSKDHSLTKLVILDAHQKRGHGTGIEHLLTQLRSRFWILKGRRAVRNLMDSCLTCRRRFLNKTAGQMMAPLPKVRVQMPSCAFDTVQSQARQRKSTGEKIFMLVYLSVHTSCTLRNELFS